MQYLFFRHYLSIRFGCAVDGDWRLGDGGKSKGARASTWLPAWQLASEPQFGRVLSILMSFDAHFSHIFTLSALDIRALSLSLSHSRLVSSLVSLCYHKQTQKVSIQFNDILHVSNKRPNKTQGNLLRYVPWLLTHAPSSPPNFRPGNYIHICEIDRE
jgi:hypothetical protein